MKNATRFSAIAAISSVLCVGAVALACEGHEGKGGGLAHMDSNADGKVTQAEMLATWTARFDAADANKDGTVTDAERTSAHAAHMKERITSMDANKNGAIEKSEAKGPLAHFFTDIDTDKNGTLSSAELDAHRAKFEKDHPGREHKGDHDKASTKAELTAKATEHFKRLDSNGDGVLSGDELTRGGHRGHHGGHHDHGSEDT